jgi:PAS domain S-box-containing protein
MKEKQRGLNLAGGGSAAGGSRMERLLRQMPAALVRLDREGRLVYCSAAFRTLAALHAAECVSGRRAAELGDAALGEALQSVFDGLKKGGGSLKTELRLNRGGEGAKSIAVEAVRADDDCGGFDGVIALCREAREPEERIRAMLDATPLACFLMDQDGRVYECSEEALRLFGAASKHEFKDSFLSAFMPEYQSGGGRSREEMLNRLRSVLEGRGRMHFEWEHRTAAGGIFPAAVTLVRTGGADGPRVAVYVRDLTEMKASEEQRRLAESRSRTMLDAMPLACVLLNNDDKVIDCNVAALQLFEVPSKDSVLKQYYGWMPEYQPSGQHSLSEKRRRVQEVFKTGRACFPWMYQSFSGEPLPAEVTLVRVEWNSLFCIAAYIRDMRGIYEKEKEAREAEERTLAMLDASPLACSLWDENGVMIDCNQAAIQLLGVKDKAAYIKSFFAVNPRFQPDGEPTYDKAMRLLKAAFETGFQRFNWMYLTAWGEELPAETVLRRIPWKGGYRITAYSRDLRESIAAQKEKDEAEERMRRMLDTSPLICMMWDADLNLLDCNQEALRVFGAADKAAFLKTFPRNFIPECQNDGEPTHQRGVDALRTALANGRYQYKCTYLTSSGELLPTETIHIRIAWKDTYHIIVYCRDLRSITSKEKAVLRAEEELNLKKNQLDLMADINKFTYWQSSPEDNIAFSYHLEREFGYSPEEITKIGFYGPPAEGSGTRWIDIVHPEDRNRVLRDITGYITGASKRYRSEFRVRHKNGGYLWAVSSGQIIKWKKGRPVVIGGVFNINDFKRTESANTAKSRFLASMSHEIRTPMNAIIGMSDLIRMDNMDARQKEFFHDLRLMSKSLLQIINDILDFSKIESEKMELLPVHFDLLRLYDTIVSLNRFMAENKGLEFRSSFDRNVARVVYGDDVRIRQVVTNILSNAVKYTQRGFVDFRVKPVVENGRTYTAFQVEDSGAGIREADAHRLFDWYEQLDVAHNRGISGTGLGLPIAKSFVDMMDGRITMRSVYGKGSTFTVLLPLQPGDPARLERPAGPDLVAAAPGVKVLVVDDNAINLKVALAYLEKHNIKADTAANGLEALAKIQETQYRLIFMDHMMPEMDGIETVARIRAAPLEWCRTVPIIALSANAVAGAGGLFLESGMNDCLYKPIEADKLNRVIGAWLPPECVSRAPPVPPDKEAGTPRPETPDADSALIDRNAGAANAAGSEDLYRRLLCEFKLAHAGDMRAIQTAQEAGDYQSARRTAHTLKSTANLIGAKTLGGAALAVEQSLNRSGGAAADQALLERLERELNAVLAELDRTLPRAPRPRPLNTGRALDPAKAEALIARLEPLLESGSAESLDMLDEIRETLGPAGDACAELLSLIENLDFAEAAAPLKRIRGLLPAHGAESGVEE